VACFGRGVAGGGLRWRKISTGRGIPLRRTREESRMDYPPGFGWERCGGVVSNDATGKDRKRCDCVSIRCRAAAVSRFAARLELSIFSLRKMEVGMVDSLDVVGVFE
jgi:hypothetical protein